MEYGLTSGFIFDSSMPGLGLGLVLGSDMACSYNPLTARLSLFITLLRDSSFNLAVSLTHAQDYFSKRGALALIALPLDPPLKFCFALCFQRFLHSAALGVIFVVWLSTQEAVSGCGGFFLVPEAVFHRHQVRSIPSSAPPPPLPFFLDPPLKLGCCIAALLLILSLSPTHAIWPWVRSMWFKLPMDYHCLEVPGFP